jgi:hypothetical protein
MNKSAPKTLGYIVLLLCPAASHPDSDPPTCLQIGRRLRGKNSRALILLWLDGMTDTSDLFNRHWMIV